MKVKQAVLEVLSTATCDGTSLKLTGQLDRKLYLDTNKVIEACGGKWNRKAQTHVFGEDAQPLIDTVILTGEVRTHREDGWFPTPDFLAVRVAIAAGICGRMRVLEPSAGEGSLVEAVRRAAPEAPIVAIEINDKRFLKLASVGSRVGNIVMFPRDFLDDADLPSEGQGGFHRVVMNPPFAKGQDVAHVTKAFSMLLPCGRLVAIMSAGIKFRMDRRYIEFRELVTKNNGSIVPLPDDSFKSSGTEVRTVLVTIDAPPS